MLGRTCGIKTSIEESRRRRITRKSSDTDTAFSQRETASFGWEARCQRSAALSSRARTDRVIREEIQELLVKCVVYFGHEANRQLTPRPTRNHDKVVCELVATTSICSNNAMRLEDLPIWVNNLPALDERRQEDFSEHAK
jgi:hypothetical protein